MSTTYKAQEGDTFARVSRLVFGSEFGAADIGRANPGVAEPIPAGTRMTIPTAPSLSLDRRSQEADLVELVIGPDAIGSWQSMKFVKTVDGLDSIVVTSPQTEQTRQLLRPFGYTSAAIKIGGITQFVGTVVDVVPVVDDEAAMVTLTAYATPGVLQDCTMSAASYESTREFVDLNAYEVARTMSSPLGVRVKLDTGPTGLGSISAGSAFPLLSVDYGETVWDFLVKITQQRGLILSNDRLGALLMREQPKTTTPVAIFQEGQPPLLSVVPSFKGQQFFSSVTAIAPATLGDAGAAYTVENPIANGVNRPYVYTAGDATEGNVRQAAEAKLQRMIVSAASYRCEVSTWRDPSGELWAPGSTVSLQAKNAGIKVAFLFVVRGVEFEQSSTTGATTAVLNLTIPGDAEGAPWAF